MKNIFVILMSVLLYSACYGPAIADLDGIEDVKIVDYNGRYVSYYSSPDKLIFEAINLDSVFCIHGITDFKTLYDEQKQDSIAKIFNDLSYRTQLVSKFTSSGTSNATCHVSTDSISSIEIVSDKDFDATHPAGTNLNDIFNLFCFSIDKFIKNEYDTSITELQLKKEWFKKMSPYEFTPKQYLMFEEGSSVGGKCYLYPIRMKANEVNFSNTRLLGEYMSLYTRVKPVVKGKHNITLRIIFSEKELNTSLVVDFDNTDKDHKGRSLVLSKIKRSGRNLSFLLK